MSAIVHLCERCGAQLDTASPDVEYAVKIERLDALHGPFYVAGIGAYFHAWCYPEGSTDYRRKPKT